MTQFDTDRLVMATFALIVISTFILSPFVFGMIWFWLTGDALSAAVIGIFCGGIFDFILWVTLS
jgi:hypothetical protein